VQIISALNILASLGK